MVKVCGARTREDLRVLAGAGVDLAGVWCGVPGGHADLRPDVAAELLAATAPEPVLVTLRGEGLLDLVRRTGARRVQLHGHQPPNLVRGLVRAGVSVIKVLHLRGGRCLQEGLVPAYLRAGVSAFLLDAADGDRLGSTGTSADPALVAGVAARLGAPFLLAGGITPADRGRFSEVVAHPGFLGVDVDTAARDARGALSAARVAALVRGWAGARP
ncbi:hypothetical protein BJP25_05815 [Actinokineospora bangkokensis]|uniref:N-(5'-phosphoribosyl)anthranilate isomerase n=1 Tax=Actinokineospora bangkokensis TaxID=1193682 RepID=A0A1Q9LC78_9PSEU|nr:hypothetical protein BJP25_05815 [Actinokineospora bangkokensis]